MNMLSYCSNSENILARNVMIQLFTVEIIAMSWLWYILNIDIVLTIPWLASCTHKMKGYGQGYLSMGKVLENLKDDLNIIVDQPELIHDESFIMGMMDPWAVELPPFQEYLDQKLKQQKTNYFNLTSTTKVVPLNELRKDLFYPINQDNKDSTTILEDLGVVYATRWVQELLDPNRDNYPLISESAADYSWDGSPDNLKEAFLGFMSVNYLAEISLSGTTSKFQVFGQIGMDSAAAIRNMARNGLLDRPTTNKQMSDQKRVCFMIFQRSCR